MKTVTQAEFARMEGVNRSTVNRWIKAGRIEADANGRIDPDAARRQRHATESPEPHHQARKAQIEAEKAAQAAAPDPAQPYATPNATDPAMPGVERIGAALKLETYKLQKAKAERAAMEVDKLAGSLIERAEVESVLADFGHSLRRLMESLPDRLAGPLAAHRGDANAIHRALEESGGEILQEMAEHMKRKMETLTE